MIVMKFGGSSVKDAERISSVKDIIINNINEKPIIVSSALGKTTDLLIEAGKNALEGTVDISHLVEHHTTTTSSLGITTECFEALFDELLELLEGIRLIKEISPKTSDYLVSFGERLAVRVISSYLNANNVPAKYHDAWDIGMITDDNYTDAKISPKAYQNIKISLEPLKENYTYTPIITGFLGKCSDGFITTFGRGGSDLSATTIGAAIKAKEVQVWKDVDGLMTADPRLVDETRPVNYVSFEEAAELSYFGAKVLHPLSMQPAKEHNIPVRVKNSYSPETIGTIIGPHENYAQGPIKSITIKRNITLIDVCSNRMLGAWGFLAKVFSIFDKYKIPVDLLASSEVSISFTIDKTEELLSAVNEINEFAEINVLKEHAIVSLICDAKNSSAILDNAFGKLATNGLNPKVISQGASKSNIGMVFEEKDAERALCILHSSILELYREAA